MLTLCAQSLHSLVPFPHILHLLPIFEPLHGGKIFLGRHLQDEHVLLREVECLRQCLDKLVREILGYFKINERLQYQELLPITVSQVEVVSSPSLPNLTILQVY